MLIKHLISSGLLLASLNAQAMLTSYSNGEAGLVYSSVSNVTWTKDANLLGSLFASNGFSTTVNAIILASPTITDTPNTLSPTGSYTLSSADFDISGTTTWWGALGFTNYLSSINYGGSHDWRLPSVANTTYSFIFPTNGSAVGDELPELFYRELGGAAYASIPDTTTFDNEKSYSYWSGTEYEPLLDAAWGFYTYSGGQPAFYKFGRMYAWAVSTGEVAPIPEPETYAMLIAGLGLMGFVARRKAG